MAEKQNKRGNAPVASGITARKELELQEKWFNAIFHGARDAIFISNEQTQFANFNRAAEILTGYSSDDLSSMSIQDLHAPEDLTAFKKFFSKIMSGEEITSEAKILRKDGTKISVEFSNKSLEIDGKRYMHTIARDISRRKQAEEALNENYKKYYSFLNNTPEGIYLQQLKKPVKTSLPIEKQIDEVYENAYFAECNNALTRMYGLSSQKELLGKRLLDFHGGKNHPVNRAEMRRFIKNGYRESSEISHETCMDGKERWFLNTTTGVVEDGKLLYLWGTHSDITEMRRAEEEVIKLSEAITQLEEIVVITDSEGNIHYTNPAFEKITGYTAEKMLGQKPSLLIGGQHSQKFYSGLWKTITKGKCWTGNLTNKRSDGSFFTTYSTISPVKNQEGEITNFVWISRDITEELSLKKNMEHAQKMEAVGTLAGGIAHDFNNILTSILGFTELTLKDAEKGSVLEERLQAVHSAGRRARDLVKQILTFARKSDEELKPIQVNIIIKETLHLLRSTLPATIEINQNINSDSMIMGAPTHIHQVIMNLCTNAAQAMEDDGGVLKVNLRDIRLASSFTKKHIDLNPGDYLKLEISDTGKGIPLEIIESIFDPYFTTKATGKGTGMGLATVHGIIKRYRGEILVESKLNKGTVFTVYLPVCRKKGKTKRHKANNLPGGSENILIVDDEIQVAKITGLNLSGLGYNVKTLTSSLEALELFRSDPDAFDLVITDMTMPGLTGDKLTNKLLSIKPGLPVILFTGYAKKFAGKEANIKGIRAFAYKPVTSADMANIVRGVLDGDQGTQNPGVRS